MVCVWVCFQREAGHSFTGSKTRKGAELHWGRSHLVTCLPCVAVLTLGQGEAHGVDTCSPGPPLCRVCAGPSAREVLSGDALLSPQLPASLPDPQESPGPCSMLGVPWLPVTAVCPLASACLVPGWSRQNVGSCSLVTLLPFLPFIHRLWTAAPWRARLDVCGQRTRTWTLTCALTCAVLHKGLECLRVLISGVGSWNQCPADIEGRL